MTPAGIDIARLHATILESIIERGFAPTVDEPCAQFGVEDDAIANALDALQSYHGVVLHPHRPAAWVIHPFSTAPTTFLLRAADRRWWGNCAWCALGAAGLLKRDVTITTLLGAEHEPVAVHVQDGRLLERDYVVHFPVPMREAWDNVIYTCSTMLLFRDAAQVDDWCGRHRIRRGDVRPIETVWEFAEAWYANHQSPTWKKWTTEEARQIFARFGLTGDTWALPSTDERF